MKSNKVVGRGSRKVFTYESLELDRLNVPQMKVPPVVQPTKKKYKPSQDQL